MRHSKQKMTSSFTQLQTWSLRNSVRIPRLWYRTILFGRPPAEDQLDPGSGSKMEAKSDLANCAALHIWIPSMLQKLTSNSFSSCERLCKAMHTITPRFPLPATLAFTLYPFTLVQRSCDSVQKLRNAPFPIVVCAEREKMNERVTPGLCAYYFSARFQKLAAPFSFCQAFKEKHMIVESKLGHFRFFILRPSNLGLFRLCLQHVARKKIYSENWQNVAYEIWNRAFSRQRHHYSAS